MKNNILSLLIFISILIVGCSKSDDNQEQTPINNCAALTSFNVTQQTDALSFTLTSTVPALYYEISFLIAQSNDMNPDYGQKIILNNLSETKLINDLSIAANYTYLFYARAICTDGSKSNWSTAKSLLINDFCNSPKNLNFTYSTQGPEFYWDSNDDQTSYYQVQYGPEGFTFGSGATVSLNNDYFNGMPLVANTTYDFYVRSFCTSTLGWSSWSGPYTYLSVSNQNLCSVPTNINYTIVRNGSNQAIGANFTWNYNGENNFEYTIVSPNQTANQGELHSIGTFSTPTYLLTQNTNYHFYVRGVCANGNRTAWSTPKLVNIGS